MSGGIERNKLKEFSLFEGLTDEQIDRVGRVMTVRKFSQDDVIIKEGEEGGEMFVLIEGAIVISKSLTLNIVEQPELGDKSLIQLDDSQHIFFGEMGLFGSDKRSATVKALTDVQLGALNRDQALRLAEEDPRLGYRLFYNIGKKLAGNVRRGNRDALKLTTALCLALEGR